MDVQRLPMRKLLQAIVNRVRMRGYHPLYIECPYWEDESISMNNDGEPCLVFLPAQYVYDVPVRFVNDEVIRVCCNNDYAVDVVLKPDRSGVEIRW